MHRSSTNASFCQKDHPHIPVISTIYYVTFSFFHHNIQAISLKAPPGRDSIHNINRFTLPVILFIITPSYMPKSYTFISSNLKRPTASHEQ